MSIETNFISFESKIIELILTQQCISITYKGTFNYLEPKHTTKKRQLYYYSLFKLQNHKFLKKTLYYINKHTTQKKTERKTFNAF